MSVKTASVVGCVLSALLARWCGLYERALEGGWSVVGASALALVLAVSVCELVWRASRVLARLRTDRQQPGSDSHTHRGSR